MPAETAQRIQNAFETSCIELFRSLDCNVTKLAENADTLQDAPLTYIDAGSEDMEIVVVLRAPLPVLSITYPGFDLNDILSVSEAQLEDWISELVNQLVGRFKNKMLNFGCNLQIGLPEMLYNAPGVKLPVAKHDAYRCCFDIDKERIECSLYVQLINQNLVLTPQHNNDGASEGELELF